jgi:fructose-bisphosphate aldolase class I
LYEETLGQSTDDGRPFVELLQAARVVPGIKLDTGVQPLPGGAPNETWTAGLDTLAARAAEFRAAGARFAKWRAVVVVDAATGAPTPLALHEAAHGLARYAVICQAAGLVPIMEPEVLADGAHSAEQCAAATEATLHALFAACAQHGVRLEGALLKPNMVTPGDAAPGGRPPPAEVRRLFHEAWEDLQAEEQAESKAAQLAAVAADLAELKAAVQHCDAGAGGKHHQHSASTA